MWFCFREIRLHIVVHHSKRHFHGNLTAGKFGISGQRETSACPGLKNEPAFQQARLMEPFSLQCSVSVRCTLRQKFLRLLFVLQFGWYFHTARQGVPHPCGPVQPHIAFAPDSPALQLQNLRSCQGFGQSSFQLSRWAFPFLPVCNFDKRMYARILTCVGIMTHVRRTFLPIPSMGDPEHTHPDSESRCSIISIVTFSGGSSSTCRDRSCRIWGSAAVPLIAALIDNHASVSSSIGLS